MEDRGSKDTIAARPPDPAAEVLAALPPELPAERWRPRLVEAPRMEISATSARLAALSGADTADMAEQPRYDPGALPEAGLATFPVGVWSSDPTSDDGGAQASACRFQRQRDTVNAAADDGDVERSLLQGVEVARNHSDTPQRSRQC